MAVPFSNTSLRVPRGFQNLLEGLAREVLRCQPKGEQEIYDFAATYFNRLVAARDKSGTDPARIGAAHEDLMYNGETLRKGGKAAPVAPPQADDDEELPDLNAKDVQDATLKIQAGFRGMMARKAMKTEASPDGGAAAMEVPTAKEEEEEEEEMPDLNDADVQAATLKIQAGFKGYKVRKEMKEKETKTGEGEAAAEAAAAAAEAPAEAAAAAAAAEEEELPDLNAKDVQDATLKIQAGFRGMKARKALKEEKEAEPAGEEPPQE